MAFVKVYVSDEERERLVAQADAQGLALSAFAHARLFEDRALSELPVELRAVLQDHEERLAELEEWHERSRAMLQVYKAKGWVDPLEDPDGARILKMSEFQ